MDVLARVLTYHHHIIVFIAFYVPKRPVSKRLRAIAACSCAATTTKLHRPELFVIIISSLTLILCTRIPDESILSDNQIGNQWSSWYYCMPGLCPLLYITRVNNRLIGIGLCCVIDDGTCCSVSDHDRFYSVILRQV